MTLAKKLQSDLHAAMKARDEQRTSTLRLIRAKLLEKEAEKAGVQLTDDVVQKILELMVKQYKDTIAEFEKAGRVDTADKERAEMQIVQSYLPEEVSEEEITRCVDDAIAQTRATSAREMGKVMGAAMARLKQTGKLIDGTKVKAIVESKLK